MNTEGMEDRYYFSDWGSCICEGWDDINPECPLSDEHTEEMEEED